jgi:hypothetical protein
MKTIITILSIFLCSFLHGQYGYKLFGSSPSLVQPSSRGGHVDLDGNILLVFYDRHMFPGDFDICLTKTDPLGDVLWSKKYRIPGTDEDVCPTVLENSTSYVLLGTTGVGLSNTNGILLSINKLTGVCNSAKVFGGDSFDYFTFGAKISEQSFVVCGYTGNPSFSSSASNRGDGFVAEITFALDTLRTRRIGANNLFDKFDRLIKAVDGNILLVGTRKPFAATPVGTPADYDDVSLVKLSYTSFNPTWLRLYNHSGNLIEQPSALMQSTNGNIYIATQLPMLGSAGVIRLGSSGNVLAKTKLDGLTALGLSPHLGVSVLGFKGYGGIVTRLDPNLLSVGFSNSYGFGSPAQASVWSLKTTPSGLVAFGGSNGNTKLFQLRADGFGQLGCGESLIEVSNSLLSIDTSRVFNATLGRYPYKGVSIGVETLSIGHSTNICESSVLPLNSIDAFAEQVDDRVLLGWGILSAAGVDGFEVERSKDGLHFESVTRVVCDPTRTEYSFRDDVLWSGDTYYRISAVDAAGFVLYTVNVSLVTELNVLVYPNPNNGTFCLSSSMVPFTLHNSLGGVLFSSELTCVSVPDLKPGIYTIVNSQTGRSLRMITLAP